MTTQSTFFVPKGAPLGRFTVIDLSRVRSGPTASRQLADWGANVISIEQPETLDGSDPHVGPRTGSDFQNLNRNRRSITLNLKHPDGVAILKRLVATADVLLENFRPDVKDRLGINYETLSAINPRLIYASISGFGQEGPYRNRPGFDQIAQGMGGIMSVTGNPGEGPLRAGVPVGDLCAGIFCSQGIMVALLEREVSGKGQWVQTSLIQSLAFMLDFQAARYLMDGAIPKQHGNFHPTIVPTGAFRTGEGHINLAVVGPTMWKRFCLALDRSDWLSNPLYLTNADRHKNQDQLHADIETVLATHPSQYWVDFFNTKSVPCGPIYRIDEMFNDEQFKTLGMVQTYKGDREKEIPYLGQPMSLSRTQSQIFRHPPDLGEHTTEVLREIGFSERDLEAFKSSQVI